MEKFSPEALKFSDSAVAHFTSSIQNRGIGLGVRIGVKKAGCSGFEYFFDYVDDVSIEGKDIIFHEKSYTNIMKIRIH